jgi:hypothetical protein
LSSALDIARVSQKTVLRLDQLKRVRSIEMVKKRITMKGEDIRRHDGKRQHVPPHARADQALPPRKTGRTTSFIGAERHGAGRMQLEFHHGLLNLPAHGKPTRAERRQPPQAQGPFAFGDPSHEQIEGPGGRRNDRRIISGSRRRVVRRRSRPGRSEPKNGRQLSGRNPPRARRLKIAFRS